VRVLSILGTITGPLSPPPISWHGRERLVVLVGRAELDDLGAGQTGITRVAWTHVARLVLLDHDVALGTMQDHPTLIT
jgi:hypothetical protein